MERRSLQWIKVGQAVKKEKIGKRTARENIKSLMETMSFLSTGIWLCSATIKKIA